MGLKVKHTTIRAIFRFALIAIILWTFVQSCVWLGEVTDVNRNNNNYPYYHNKHRTHDVLLNESDGYGI